jgi:hypothetical protein
LSAEPRAAHLDPDRVQYPPYVVGPEERRRWWLAEWIAAELYGDLDPALVWQATRAIYRSEMPTD